VYAWISHPGRPTLEIATIKSELLVLLMRQMAWEKDAKQIAKYRKRKFASPNFRPVITCVQST
jgi:hypothetical protein